MVLVNVDYSEGYPSTPTTVEGVVRYNNGSGVENGINVHIEDLNNNNTVTTQVSAPPIPDLAGIYSAVINSNINNTLRAYAYNSTHYGINNSLVASSFIEINIVFNLSRTSETAINNTIPKNNSFVNMSFPFNVNLSIENIGPVKGIDCGVQINFSNSTVLTISNNTIFLGNISSGEIMNVSMNVTPLNIGTSNITLTSSCSSDGFNLEQRNISTIYNITVHDVNPPEINLIIPENDTQIGKGNINFSYFVLDVNLNSCSLYSDRSSTWESIQIELLPTNNATSMFLPEFFDFGIYTWNVYCDDIFGNGGFAQNNFTFNITFPDINITKIFFGNAEEIEGINRTLFVNLTNVGLSDAETPFEVQFFYNDPDNGGMQIGSNITVSNLSINQMITLNKSFSQVQGRNNIFILVNKNKSLNESDYTNNKKNNSFSITAYQVIYGDITNNYVLENSKSELIFKSLKESNNTGHVLVTDIDANPVFTTLMAIGRKNDSSPSNNDFSELDTVLGMSEYLDSINTIWASGTNNPSNTSNITIFGTEILYVPIKNSTNNSNFFTGILWDYSDDTSLNGEFDTTDKEDIIFVTQFNIARQGAYGIYDYELSYPVNIRDYISGDAKVKLYLELT